MNIERARIDKDGKYYIEQINSKGHIGKFYGTINICKHCGISFFARKDKVGKHCSNKCQMVEQSPNVKHHNGKLLSKNGYVLVKIKGANHMKSGYSYEHRIIAEQIIKRKLNKNEHVHHLDGNKTNNNANNLIVINEKDHIKLYHGR